MCVRVRVCACVFVCGCLCHQDVEGEGRVRSLGLRQFHDVALDVLNVGLCGRCVCSRGVEKERESTNACHVPPKFLGAAVNCVIRMGHV